MENSSYINKALEFIGKAWKDEDISLDKVAREAGFSAAYFDRMFSENTGKSVMEFVRIYKLIQSALLLRTSDKSILDIALELGYSNPENFTRAFKGIYELSPSEYREKHMSIALAWKDLSTGTVIRRFESMYPHLQRIDPDEFIDFLLFADPLKHAATICMLSQMDCAVYKLSDDKEYIYIEEYSPDEMILTLFCKPENLNKYILIAKTFPKYSISFTCDRDFVLPSDMFGFAEDRLYEQYDYAYLKNSIDYEISEHYQVRELVESDEAAVISFSRGRYPVVSMVFQQKYKHGNNDTSKLFGLFYKGELVGCDISSFEQARNLKISDLGSLLLLPEHNTESNLKMLYSFIVERALKEEYLPVNGGSELSDICVSLGYTLISKRFTFTNVK